MNLIDKPPERDMERSVFADILSDMDDVCPGFISVVFYDKEGETIDYHSYLAPYDTRLIAAHLGVVALCAMRSFKKLEFGEIEYIETYADQRDMITISMGDGLFISVVVTSGNLNQAIHRKILQVIDKLREEIYG